MKKVQQELLFPFQNIIWTRGEIMKFHILLTSLEIFNFKKSDKK
jgi:hypothetical protein